MGIIQSGILSKVSGKVAGVVGGSWKNKAYLRAYVKPANPNTVAQQAQRSAFAQCVEFAQPLLGQVIQPFRDPFVKNMSGFNSFIKMNIDEFPDPVNWTVMKLAWGTLSWVSLLTGTYSGSDVSVTWAPNNGNNGLDDDSVFLVVRDKSTKRVYFAAEAYTRVTAAGTVDCGAGLTATNLTVWAITYRAVAGKTTHVGWSSARNCVAP